MLFNRMILLLCLTYASGTENQNSDDILDQIATASENVAVSLVKVKELDTEIISTTLSPEIAETTSIHYENSNGFVPMVSSQNYRSGKILSYKKNTTSSEENRSTSPPLPNYSSSVESDPVYSTEARMLLNLPHGGVIRRSFDSQDGQKQFEILKVNDQTPAIANFHEFYENVQSNLNRGNGFQQSESGQDSANIMRTRERIKQIDDYLSYGVDQQRANTHSYSQFYPSTNSNKALSTNSMFEPEKVYSNYPQTGVSNYNIFGESVTRQRTSSLPRTNYESSDNSKINRENLSSKIRHESLNPVIVVEPSGYKVNLKYDNKQSVAKVSTMNPYKNQNNEKDGSEDRYDKNGDYGDDGTDYLEITERPRRIHKSRRRPHNFDSSKKLPKEHRGQIHDDNGEETKKPNTSIRTKSQRSRAKPSQWTDDSNGQENNSDDNSHRGKLNEASKDEDKNQDQQQHITENQNTWSQLAPNVEFSQSSGFQLNQIDKPNVLVPVNLNLVPLTNFDHSSALGTSHGFDISNAGISNFVTANSIVSTASPLISTSPSVLTSNQSPQTLKNYAYSTSVPDIIVGQNSYQNPVQAVFLQNKYTPNGKTQYFPSTVAPMFAVSPSTVSSKQANQGNSHVHQFFLPQPTLQTFLQSPTTANGNYNILVNTRGLNGQNQQTAPQNNNNNGNNASQEPDNTSKKNTFTGSNGQYLASASLSVGNNGQLQNNNAALSNVNNNIYASTQNHPQVLRPQLPTNVKTYIPAQVLPALFQTNNGIPGSNLINQNQGQQQQQVVNVANNIFENTWKQLQQLKAQEDQNKNFRLPYQSFYGNSDSIGSTSNNHNNIYNSIQNTNRELEKAQLPVVGMQTVEIRNPNINIKPSPVDVTAINPFGSINQYQAAVLTTPIPIFSTATGFLTPRPVVTSTTPESISIQSYVDSLTQIGAQNNQGTLVEMRTPWRNQPADFPMYNPMNFVPNSDLVNSQSILNSKAHVPDALPQHLNLVPLVPGGNFYKHSPSAQIELIHKPKLSSDLEQYAEEMFKESLRTIYNTHKWNSDKKIRNLTSADLAELERLKNELARIKASMTDSKNIKEILEAHHSETKLQTADPFSSNKRPGLTVNAIEELFKSNFNQPLSSDSYQNIKTTGPDAAFNVKELSDYLTPPKRNTFVSKSPFSDNKPIKKRPGSKGTRHEKGKPRTPIRGNNHGTRPGGIETAASSHISHKHRRPHYDREKSAGFKEQNFDNYPTFTTSTPEIFYQIPSDYKTKNDIFDINHPRSHNLLGLLMKNKQLPSRASPNLFRDVEDVKKFLEDEKRREELKFYEETMQSFQQRSDSSFKSELPHTKHRHH